MNQCSKSVGDYILYDARTWTETKERPTSHGEFDGYSAEKSKANGVDWCLRESDAVTSHGWQVLKKENREVYLIHAGMPECYRHDNSIENPNKQNDESIAILNQRATSTYVNGTYVSSAYHVTMTDFSTIPEDNNLRMIGFHYWLSSKIETGGLGYWTPLGVAGNNFGGASAGIRPVIILKSGV